MATMDDKTRAMDSDVAQGNATSVPGAGLDDGALGEVAGGGVIAGDDIVGYARCLTARPYIRVLSTGFRRRVQSLPGVRRPRTHICSGSANRPLAGGSYRCRFPTGPFESRTAVAAG